MKILICLNRDIMSNIAYNLLRPYLLGHEIEIFMSDSVGGQDKGVKQVALLEQVVPCDMLFPLIDQQDNEPKAGGYYTFGQIEKYDDVKITYPKLVNSDEIIAYINDMSPDLVVAIRYGQIFKEEFISLPKYGVINLHSGILPDYKGIMATFQAIIHDEDEVGCTLHFIEDAGIDTGSIIDIKKFKVCRDQSLFWHLNKIYEIGVPMIGQAVSDIDKELKITSQQQDPSQGSYFSLPTAEDEIAFIKRGFCVADRQDYLELVKRYY